MKWHSTAQQQRGGLEAHLSSVNVCRGTAIHEWSVEWMLTSVTAWKVTNTSGVIAGILLGPVDSPTTPATWRRWNPCP